MTNVTPTGQNNTDSCTVSGTQIQIGSSDPINPSHYQVNPSGVQCIEVVEHMNFNMGNAMKYLWRCDHKDDPIENLRKALWYVKRELKRRGYPEG